MSQSEFAESHYPRPEWKSRMGFILAAIGSAVGLGNIWRFSYMCYKNGGGAFLLPYFIALLVVGIPLMILELGIGHRMRGSAPLSFAKIDKRWEWSGWWPVTFVMFGIMLFYSTVIAWCLSYVFFSVNLSWGADPNAFCFGEYLRASSPLEIGNLSVQIIYALLGVWFLCWLICFFGVQKGVERANKIFMPMLFVLILILVGWSLSLEGAFDGVAVYLKPDLSRLNEWGIWRDAFSQIFFTLSLGFGIMVAYASYLPRKVNIVKDSLIICIANSVFSIIAGFAVFGTLGYMANQQGVPVDQVVDKSIGLAFVTYPKAISMLPAFQSLFGIIFFSTLVIAGITSAISIIEAFSSALIDKFGYSRKNVITTICVLGFLGSIIFAAKSSIFWVDILDHFINSYGLVTVGLLECLLVAWIFKASKLREHLNNASGTVLTPLWDISVKYIIPTVLIILLISSLREEFKVAYEGYPILSLILIGRDWLFATLFIALVFTMRRWKKEISDS